jgi:type IV secretion system protein VirB9
MRIHPALIATLACLAVVTASEASDVRLHSVPYSSDEVYRLRGYVGYQVDLEFDSGESFVGLGSGDVEALAFEAQGNHLFIKPRATNVRTNLTVLTTRRTYHFDYVAGPPHAEVDPGQIIYALRFQYPKPPPASEVTALNLAFSQQANAQPHNTDYWYCGGPELQPLKAWDDGVHTHLRFNPRIEMPAVFVHNDDGSESLLNFSIEDNDVIIHRIARQFMVRRGKLVGCIVNRGYAGVGAALDSGTVSPMVRRATLPTEMPR